MKILSRTLLLAFLVFWVLVALSNREPVPVGLWPLAQRIELPAFLLIAALLLIGVLAGLVIGWFGAHRHRALARHRGVEMERLEREIAKLKARVSEGVAPAGSVGAVAPADGRALARQQALVDPDSVEPTSRSR